MKKILLILSIITILTGLSGQAFERLNFDKGFISDNAHILTQKDYFIINGFLWDLHNKTTADLAVVTVRSLHRDSVRDTAMYIAKAFQIGGIGKDNGVVLLIAPKEQTAAIYTGYDLDSIISPERKEQIISNCLNNRFNKKDISQGVYEAATILSADIAEYYNTKISGLDYSIVPKKPIKLEHKISIIYYIISIILFMIGGLIWFGRKRKSAPYNINFAFGGSAKYNKNW